MSQIARRLATAVELARLPEGVYAEVIHGAIVERAAPSAEHGDAQSQLAVCLGDPFALAWREGRRLVDSRRSDQAGSAAITDRLGRVRRERMPTRRGAAVRVRPDWV